MLDENSSVNLNVEYTYTRWIRLGSFERAQIGIDLVPKLSSTISASERMLGLNESEKGDTHAEQARERR